MGVRNREAVDATKIVVFLGLTLESICIKCLRSFTKTRLFFAPLHQTQGYHKYLIRPTQGCHQNFKGLNNIRSTTGPLIPQERQQAYFNSDDMARHPRYSGIAGVGRPAIEKARRRYLANNTVVTSGKTQDKGEMARVGGHAAYLAEVPSLLPFTRASFGLLTAARASSPFSLSADKSMPRVMLTVFRIVSDVFASSMRL